MNIIKYPDPILKTICEEVKLPLSKEDAELLDNLYKTMKEVETAVGLAAPQVGVPKRMFVIRLVSDGKCLFNCKMVNPKIIPTGPKTYVVPGGEGCLSEPDINIEVPRYKTIILLGYDAIKKQNVHYQLNGYLAAIAQHEMDHLNGILLHDYCNKE